MMGRDFYRKVLTACLKEKGDIVVPFRYQPMWPHQPNWPGWLIVMWMERKGLIIGRWRFAYDLEHKEHKVGDPRHRLLFQLEEDAVMLRMTRMAWEEASGYAGTHGSFGTYSEYANEREKEL